MTAAAFGMLSIAFLVSSASGHAQGCCGGGSPVGGTLQFAIIQRGELRAGADYEYLFANQTYSGSTRLIPNPNDQSRFTRNGIIEAAYGASKRIMVDVSFSGSVKERTFTSLNPATNETLYGMLNNGGWGDIAATVRYAFIPFSVLEGRMVTFGVGIGIPTGNGQQSLNGVELPIDMQTSTGDYSVTASVYGYQSFEDRFSAFGYAILQQSARNANGYWVGTDVKVSTGGSYLAGSTVESTIQMIFDISAPDVLQGETKPSTGLQSLSAVLGVNLYVTNVLTIHGFARKALLYNVNGEQLVLNYSIGASFEYSFF